MSDRGFPPNLVAYNSVISACAKANEVIAIRIIVLVIIDGIAIIVLIVITVIIVFVVVGIVVIVILLAMTIIIMLMLEASRAEEWFRKLLEQGRVRAHQLNH